MKLCSVVSKDLLQFPAITHFHWGTPHFSASDFSPSTCVIIVSVISGDPVPISLVPYKKEKLAFFPIALQTFRIILASPLLIGI